MTGIFKINNNEVFGSDGTFSGTIGSGATGFTGVKVADQFRLNTDDSLADSSSEDITANIERVDDATSGIIGSGMPNPQNGIFTFPATGIYLVSATGAFFRSGNGSQRVQIFIAVSSDSGSNYDDVSNGEGSITNKSTTEHNFGNASCSAIIDVTNHLTFRVKFRSYSETAGVSIAGRTDRSETHFTFIRLGDT